MSEMNPHKLPISGSGCGRIRISGGGGELVVKYEYFSDEDERDYIGKIRFSEADAYRFRKEMLSAGFVSDSYDSIVEVSNSKWQQSLLKIEPHSLLSTIEEKKHFAMFLSNNGYLEVIARSWEELPREEGFLSD